MLEFTKRGGRRSVGLRSLIVVFMLSALVVAGGCSDDDDDNNTGTGPNQPVYRDLTVNLSEMTTVQNQRIQFRLVNDNDSVIAVAIIDTMRSADTSFVMPDAVPRGTHRLEIYVDTNLSGTYDAPPTDLAWSVTVPSSGSVSFTYDTTFTDIGTSVFEPGDSLTINMVGLVDAAGQMMEVRVSDSTTGQTVGLYRNAAITSNGLAVTFPGIAQTGRTYQIDIFTDANASGSYDEPPTDNAWRTFVTGTDTGAETDFIYNTDFTDIDF